MHLLAGLWSRRSRVRIPSLTPRKPCKQPHFFPGHRRPGTRRGPTGSKLASELGSDDPPDDPPRPLLGDEEELFRSYHRQLARTVQRLVNTSPDIVDDACNFAWTEFIRCQPDRSRGWRGWLITTAQREAWKLHAKEASHLRSELVGEDDEIVWEPADPRDTLTLRAELRDALDLLSAVPARRREVKAMHITGYTYAEIATRMGLGHARVNALITEANAAIRRENGRVAPEQQPRTDRAERLRDLETQPPKWLVKALGRAPGKAVKPGALLAWRRAALALDDYRREHAPELASDGLGPPRPMSGRRAPTTLRHGRSSAPEKLVRWTGAVRWNVDGANYRSTTVDAVRWESRRIGRARRSVAFRGEIVADQGTSGVSPNPTAGA